MSDFDRNTILAALLLFASGELAQEKVESPDRSVLMTQRMHYSALDRVAQQSIVVAGSTLNVAFAPGELDLWQATFIDWVRGRAAIIGRYYDTFPVSSARILIVPVDGEGVQHGTSFGYRGAAIKVYVGKSATRAQL